MSLQLATQDPLHICTSTGKLDDSVQACCSMASSDWSDCNFLMNCKQMFLSVSACGLCRVDNMLNYCTKTANSNVAEGVTNVVRKPKLSQQQFHI